MSMSFTHAIQKANLVAVALFTSFLIGCVSIEIKREVTTDNTFVSSSLPKLKINLGELKYIGKIEKEGKTKNSGSMVTNEYHMFLLADGNKLITRGALIRLSTIKGGSRWKEDVFSNIKYKLDLGNIKINTTNYEYAISASPLVFNNHEEIYIFDRGYKIPNCFLVKGLRRRIGTGNNILFTVIYFENMKNVLNSKYSCMDWRKKEELSTDQLEYLNIFHTNFLNNIIFLK